MRSAAVLSMLDIIPVPGVPRAGAFPIFASIEARCDVSSCWELTAVSSICRASASAFGSILLTSERSAGTGVPEADAVGVGRGMKGLGEGDADVSTAVRLPPTGSGSACPVTFRSAGRLLDGRTDALTGLTATLGVGVCVRVSEWLGVAEGDCDGVTLEEGVLLIVGEGLGVALKEGGDDMLGLADGAPEKDAVDVSDESGGAEDVSDGVDDGVAETSRALEKRSAGPGAEGDRDADGGAERVLDSDAAGVLDRLTLAVGVGSVDWEGRELADGAEGQQAAVYGATHEHI